MLRTDCKLLGSILHAGALGIVALEDAADKLQATSSVEYVVIVCDLSDHVQKVLSGLQAGGGNIRSLFLTAPSSPKRCAEGEILLSGNARSVTVSWLPLFFAPCACLPQPTIMLSGAHVAPQHTLGRANTADDFGSLAYQVACR